MGAAQGSQRFRHGAGEQDGHPRQLWIEWVGQPLRSVLMRTWWTVSMATGMGDVMLWSTPGAGIEALAVGAGAAAADGVKGLVVRGREMGSARDRLWGVGGADVAYGEHDDSPRMISCIRGTASSGPVCVRCRERMVVARCAWPMARCMARRLPPAASRCVA